MRSRERDAPRRDQFIDFIRALSCCPLHTICVAASVCVCVCVAVEFAQGCWQSVILPTKNIFANLKNHQIVIPCERIFLFGVFFLSNPDPAPSLGLSLPKKN